VKPTRLSPADLIYRCGRGKYTYAWTILQQRAKKSRIPVLVPRTEPTVQIFMHTQSHFRIGHVGQSLFCVRDRLLLVRSISFTIAHGVRRTGPAVPRSILRTRIPPASQPSHARHWNAFRQRYAQLRVGTAVCCQLRTSLFPSQGLAWVPHLSVRVLGNFGAEREKKSLKMPNEPAEYTTAPISPRLFLLNPTCPRASVLPTTSPVAPNLLAALLRAPLPLKVPLAKSLRPGR
jgi:hypothetical protein